MKISEFPTDEGFDVLCNMIPYAKAITADADIAEQLKQLAEMGKDKTKTQMQMVVACLDAIWDFVPVLLKTHRNDVYNIIALINKMQVKEIAAQPLAVTLGQIKEAIKDPELMQLFT